MDGLEALRCMREGMVVETPKYPGTMFRYENREIQLNGRDGCNRWLSTNIPADVFLGSDEWTEAEEFYMTFMQAMDAAGRGATVRNSARPELLYVMKDGVLWCMDACAVSVEGLTSDEIEAKWMTVGKE